MSKYEALAEYFENLAGNKVRLTFPEIEKIIGVRLPASARKYDAWWANSQTESHDWSHYWLQAGWEKTEVNLSDEVVYFQRVNSLPVGHFLSDNIADTTTTSSTAMNKADINAIAHKLNELSGQYAIGDLQDLRKAIKHFSKRPGSDIFSSQTIHDDWAFHHGGRSELQFNIGTDSSQGSQLRHGIAFSFETSQTLPTIDPLKPKVRLFNDFMHLYSDMFSDMRMWHYENNVRSNEYMPGPISSELVKEGVFMFLGRRFPIEELDYDRILRDFDRLLPLYRYVESEGSQQPTPEFESVPFSFSPGCTIKPQQTTAQSSSDSISVTLRHNVLQESLYDSLVSQYGKQNVGTELPSGVGTRVDVVVRQNDEYWFYEIKTAHSPRACIREAMGQLLEYSFWPKAQEASKLTIVGETPLDEDGAAYLLVLRERFHLPISYEHVEFSDEDTPD